MVIGHWIDKEWQDVHLPSGDFTIHAQELFAFGGKCSICPVHHVWIGVLLETIYFMGTIGGSGCTVSRSHFSIRQIPRFQWSPLLLFWNVPRSHILTLFLSPRQLQTQILDDHYYGHLYGIYDHWIWSISIGTSIWIYVWYSTRYCCISKNSWQRTRLNSRKYI